MYFCGLICDFPFQDNSVKGGKTKNLRSMKFEDLNIIEPIMAALRDKGYSEPTPIQAKSIPLILEENDVLGCAQTGTGKTAAFAIPIIQLIEKLSQNTSINNKGKIKIQSLIVTPTRELAIQIDDNIKSYSKNLDIQHTVIFGGVKQGKQVEKLKKGVHILTATPGRLLDLQQQGFIDLNHIKIFVLDEADRMLDMGFINDIKKLLKLIPEKRQSLFFSATMPDNIKQLSSKILNDPKSVQVNPTSSTAETINQYLYYTNRATKNDLLLHILKDPEIDQVLVFSRTKHGADRVVRNLKKNKISSGAIHGDKAQNQRQKVLKLFKDGNLRVLVATDIAARGIDIDKLRYVINYEIPNVPETYVHRIGRSGRAGEDGIAISICEPEENSFVRGIQKLIGNKINIIDENPYPQTDKPMTEKEKKEWNKEKQKRKQEYFANLKKARNGGSSKSRNPKGRNTGKTSNNGSRKVDQESTQSKSSSNQSNKSQSSKNKNRNEGRNETNNESSNKRRDDQSKKSNRPTSDSKPHSKGNNKPKKNNSRHDKNDHKSKSNGQPQNKKKGHNKKREKDSDKPISKRMKPLTDTLRNKFMWPIE